MVHQSVVKSSVMNAHRATRLTYSYTLRVSLNFILLPRSVRKLPLLKWGCNRSRWGTRRVSNRAQRDRAAYNSPPGWMMNDALCAIDPVASVSLRRSKLPGFSCIGNCTRGWVRGARRTSRDVRTTSERLRLARKVREPLDV